MLSSYFNDIKPNSLVFNLNTIAISLLRKKLFEVGCNKLRRSYEWHEASKLEGKDRRLADMILGHTVQTGVAVYAGLDMTKDAKIESLEKEIATLKECLAKSENVIKH